MDSKKLIDQVQKGQAPPAVYLYSYGEEELLREEVKTALIDNLVPPATRDFNLVHLYGEEVDAGEVINNVSLPPMMAEKRVVLISNFGRFAEGKQKSLVTYLENPSETTCLILEVPLKKDPYPQKPKGAVYNFLKKKDMVVGFKPLYDNQLPSWVQQRLKKYGKTAEREAVEVLVRQIGGSLRELDNELEKIDIYTGERKNISLADVEQVVGISKNYTVFELCKQLGYRRLPAALGIYARLLEQGAQPIAVLGAVVNQFTRIWKIRLLKQQGAPNAKIASELRISPFFVDKEYIPQARLFKNSELKKIFKLFLQTDYDLKRSYLKPKILLELLFFNICHKDA